MAMRDLSSPVGAFVREKCEVGADKQIETDVLYEAYKIWCTANEYPKAPKHVFGRDLRAAVPSIRLSQPGAAHQRGRFYLGIALRSVAAEEPL